LTDERNGDALVVAVMPHRGGGFLFLFFIGGCLGRFNELGGGLNVAGVEEEELEVEETELAQLQA
jgi:hypothetical protein